MFDNAC